jgi:peptidoglycan/LPS O-acetylase OafA/YrhL
MSNSLLVLNLVALVLLLIAFVLLLVSLRRRELPSRWYISQFLLMFLLGCILASTLIRRIWPSAEKGLLIVVALLLPITCWLIWKNLREHLRATRLLSSSDKAKQSGD